MKETQSAGESELKREVGLFQLVVYGIGNIVGAGIYVLVGDAAGLAGGLVWLAFLLGAVAAAFTGLAYAELSSMYPKAASEYVFLGRAYGNRLLSFLTEWTMLLTEVIAAAAVALGFAGYFASVFSVPLIPTAAVLLILLTLIAIAGIKQSLKLNTILSLVAVVGLLIVILAGFDRFGSTSYSYSPSGLSGVLAATALIFFAYVGFDNITNLAEETRTPERTVPRAILLSLVFTTVLYILVGLSAVSLVSWQALSTSEAPLAFAASAVMGNASFLVLAVMAMLTTVNTVLVLLIVSSRIIYGMARESVLPQVFGSVRAKSATPFVASLLVLILALGFLSIGTVSGIARVTSFGSLLTFTLVNLALLHLRRVVPNAKRSFKAPFSFNWLSLTGLLGLSFSLFLMAQLDWDSLAIGLLLPVSGVATYLLTNKGKTILMDPALHQKHEA